MPNSRVCGAKGCAGEKFGPTLLELRMGTYSAAAAISLTQQQFKWWDIRVRVTDYRRCSRSPAHSRKPTSNSALQTPITQLDGMAVEDLLHSDCTILNMSFHTPLTQAPLPPTPTSLLRHLRFHPAEGLE